MISIQHILYLSINSSSLFIVSDSIHHLIYLRPAMQTPLTMWLWRILVVVTIGTVNAASRDQWLDRSIYQVVTDRFARSDNSTTASCDAGLGVYCGGSLQGIINKLDYIQELGFDAVWISPVQSQESTRTADLSGTIVLTVNGYREQRLMDDSIPWVLAKRPVLHKLPFWHSR